MFSSMSMFFCYFNLLPVFIKEGLLVFKSLLNPISVFWKGFSSLSITAIEIFFSFIFEAYLGAFFAILLAMSEMNKNLLFFNE